MKISNQIPKSKQKEEAFRKTLEVVPEEKRKRIAERIRSLRKKHGYSQERIAEYLGVALKTYQWWESGKLDKKYGFYYPSIDYVHLFALSDLYKVSVDFLLGRSEYTAVENELIGRETGLSDTSINILKWWRQNQEMSNVSGFNLFYGNEIECLNALLEHEWKRPHKGIAQTFFSWIWLYLRSATFRNVSNNENHVELKDTLIDNKLYKADVSGLMETYTLQEITKSLQELKSKH